MKFRRKRRWTVTTESLFLKNCSKTNTRCATFQCAMATETALTELSAGPSPTSSTPPLPSTIHLKNIRFLRSTLYCLLSYNGEAALARSQQPASVPYPNPVALGHSFFSCISDLFCISFIRTKLFQIVS